jgi:L-rhamnose mutarotase
MKPTENTLSTPICPSKLLGLDPWRYWEDWRIKDALQEMIEQSNVWNYPTYTDFKEAKKLYLYFAIRRSDKSPAQWAALLGVPRARKQYTKTTTTEEN